MQMPINDVREWLRQTTNVAEGLPDTIKLDGLLSEGGQGIVYRGSFQNSPAAIKIYFPGQLFKRIEREIDALSKLDCHSIVRLLWQGALNVGEYELPVVATALVPGTPLDKLIGRRLNFDELGIIAYDVASAIQHMWQYRIVHRDLKPSNIVITPSQRACVIDLGLARHLDRSPLTTQGVTWGTFGYLSPEQTRAVRQLTCKSDLYALGVILVECALGKHPTHGDQLLLMAQDFHENLPAEIAGWEHAPLVQSLFHPRPTVRPKPEQLLEELARYAIR